MSAAKIEKLEAENAQLQAALAEKQKEFVDACAMIGDLETEIERLRAALQIAELWLDAAYDSGEGRAAYDEVCAALEIPNENKQG